MADEKAKRFAKLGKYCMRKWKSAMTKSNKRYGDQREKLVSSDPLPVSCDELYYASEKKKGDCAKTSRDDPFVAAYISAQKHFTLRANIYM